MRLRLYIYIFIGLVYLLFPRDLLPDMAGLVGRIDDILVLLFLYWRYKKALQSEKNDYQEDLRGKGTSNSSEGREEKVKEAAWDPYQVLEIDRNATKEEIMTAYRELAAKYHPDKVNHLGEELKELAHQKMLDVQRAYSELKSRV